MPQPGLPFPQPIAGPMEHAGRSARCRMAALALAVVLPSSAVLAGCTAAGSDAPPSSAAGSSGAGTPAPAASAAVSARPVVSSTPTRTPVPATVQAAAEKAVAELMAAIGNPDTGSKSDAWVAFEGALAQGDAARTRSTAEVVLGHLAAARDTMAPLAVDPSTASLAGEWLALVDGIAAGVGDMRDGGLGGSKAAIEAGQSRMQLAMFDHFWQAVAPGYDRWTAHLRDGRVVTPSRSRLTNEAHSAFDGSEDTFWSPGAVAPPQWLEVDLQWEATISGVRLLAQQGAAGPTDHRVTVRDAGGAERELARFAGTTADRQWLEYTAPTPLPGVQVVRITTLAASGLFGWREVQVLVAPGSSPNACPPGAPTDSAGVTTMGEPTTPGHETALAVDGNPTTGWDPGGTRGPGGVRGWLRILLPHPALVSQVRILLGSSVGGEATYRITGWDNAGASTELGTPRGGTTDGQSLAVAGPTPCVALSSIDVGVESDKPAAEVMEVQVIGTVAP